MKRLLLFFVLACLLTLSLGDAARALSAPAISAVDPASAYNDIETTITITGSDFASGATAALGAVPLTDVTFVDATTLTATVPWGLDPRAYDLTVTNPDGGTGTLPSALAVKQGIGQWNGGDLYGGEVRQILLKPGDPATLYAQAYGINGFFRSADAGEHWAYTGAGLPLGNGILAVDPLHAGRLYACTYQGLQRSQDDGDTWTVIMQDTWPDGRDPANTEVFPSPHDAGVLFITAHDDWGFPASGNALGLIKSTDAGTSWTIVTDLEGVSIVDLAFDPADHQQMALVTSDARVLRSTDGGDHWSEVAKPPLTAVGIRGKIAYNPSVAGEVWIASSTPAGLCKSTGAAITGWTDVTEADGMGGWDLAFHGSSVYTTHHYSADGGATWKWFGPLYGYGQIAFDPVDPQTAYLGDSVYGVQKSTDGGATWGVKDQGLTGLTCASMDVSSADPLRVYAAMGGMPGVYSSGDGANDWTFFSLPIANSVFVVREDPADSRRVYAVSHEDGFCRSTDGGETWDNLGWDLSPALQEAWLAWVMEPDPFQPGHLLAGLDTGMYLTGPGYLYDSSDYGASWQQVAMPQAVSLINDIAFDPGTPGLVYLTTNGTGVFRSRDNGATWTRIDDPQKQPGLSATGYHGSIAIATQPQHMVVVGGSDSYLYRSVDQGATWERSKNGQYPGADMFVDGDSARLYRATGVGLFFSKDLGDTWTRAAGAFGRLQILAVDYVDMDGRAIIYAATNGGQAAAAGGAASGVPRPAARVAPAAPAARTSAPVGAGVYRYVVVKAGLSLRLSGPKGTTLRLGSHVTAAGIVTPRVLAGSKVTVQVLRLERRWIAVKTVTRTSRASGAFSWSYKPARTGHYKVRVRIAATATHQGATTTSHEFRVK